ncbi:alpha/beta fold hydrolase [Celeribacter persicus]|uniref:Pimeloyl-ACP methyl ester carboxylesterase n=1 Tax=Celeribacter persicus TaxID=1651082 RepID=A0A2T5HGX0_9RHOB|nr:alpha/beta fold hydrolase [Celeribacter persicus]PTQ70812.1 pimeloyl-ACP methyl ester carboxylesterase [Celeribacter persicus]
MTTTMIIPGAASMTDPAILLIHGSAHGAWCWRDLLAELHRRGINARALDLPSHGMDKTPYAEITLDSYRDAVLADIAAHGNSPVMLVGHSAGGYAITAAAEAAPERIASLIYLCAYVPKDGMSLGDMRRAASDHPVLGLIEKTADGLAFRFKSNAGVEALCHDCSDEAKTYVRAHLGPQAIRPQETPLRVTEASRALPRHYVICENDRVIPPVEQRKMCAGWPEGTVHSLSSGHSPYFAQPERLADTLDRILHQTR